MDVWGLYFHSDLFLFICLFLCLVGWYFCCFCFYFSSFEKSCGPKNHWKWVSQDVDSRIHSHNLYPGAPASVTVSCHHRIKEGESAGPGRAFL